MNTHTSIARVLLSLFVVVLVAGCGGGQSDCGPKNDLVPNRIADDSQMDTFWIGSLVVDETRVVGSGAEHNTLIAANFSDFTDYRVQVADRINLLDYPACEVYTSRQVTSGEPVPLGLTRVTFSGLAGGDVVLEPNEFDQIPPELLPQRGFEAAQVAISVESPEGDMDFPAFDEEIAAAPQPELLAVDKQAVDLAQGPELGITSDRIEDMRIEWRPNGSDYVEIVLVPGTGSETPWGKLRCITFDDGCLTIPADLIAYLAADTASNFDLRLEHHNFVLHSIEEGGEIKAAALIDASSSLVGTIRR